MLSPVCGKRLRRGGRFFEPSITRSAKGPGGPSHQSGGYRHWRRLGGDSGTGARLEHDDRGLPGAHRRPGVVVGAELAPARPQPVTFLACRGATADGPETVLELNG